MHLFEFAKCCLVTTIKCPQQDDQMLRYTKYIQTHNYLVIECTIMFLPHIKHTKLCVVPCIFDNRMKTKFYSLLPVPFEIFWPFLMLLSPVYAIVYLYLQFSYQYKKIKTNESATNLHWVQMYSLASPLLGNPPCFTMNFHQTASMVSHI